MKNRFLNVFSVLIIVLAFAVIVTPWIIQAAAGDKASSEDDGHVEKRTLSEYPADYSNDWFSRLESYYSDHSPIRGRLIALESGVSLKYNSFYRTKINPMLTKIVVRNTESPSGATPAEGEAPTEAPTIDINIIIGLNTPEPTETPCVTGTPYTPTESIAPTYGVTAEPTPEPTPELTPELTREPTHELTSEPTREPTKEPTPEPTPHVHIYDSGKVRFGASCTHEGEKVYTCTVCGETKTEKTPKIEHNFVVKMQSTADYDNYGYTLKKCSVCGTYSLEDVVAKKVDTLYLAPEYQGGAIFGRRDWLFYSGNNSEGYYRGTNLLSDAEMEAWKNTFEQLDRVCKAKGIDLVVLVAPNKEQMYPEYMPSYQIVSQTKRQDAMLEYMSANSTVRYLYPKSELSTTKIFYDVFYKQDTHWNAMGGFTGVMAVYRALGLQTTNVFELNVKQTSRTGGDLSNFSGYTTTYREWSFSYKESVTSTVEYFENHVTSSNTELSQFTTPEATYKDKKVVVMGDSFRHAMTGIMSKDFGKSTFAHRKELNYDTPVVVDAIRELGEGDVLVLTCVERLDEDLIPAAEKLISLLG
ncbi:MAG: hypothetical protein J5950_05055 [Clostridia bacterium]|nr:hypothetical protein [Clostridia bacterium]